MARKTSSSFGLLTRSATTDACAMVNESIAPNEYIVPRKSVLPGSSTSIGITPAKTKSEMYGVLNFLCSSRKTSGNCR